MDRQTPNHPPMAMQSYNIQKADISQSGMSAPMRTTESYHAPVSDFDPQDIKHEVYLQEQLPACLRIQGRPTKQSQMNTQSQALPTSLTIQHPHQLRMPSSHEQTHELSSNESYQRSSSSARPLELSCYDHTPDIKKRGPSLQLQITNAPKLPPTMILSPIDLKLILGYWNSLRYKSVTIREKCQIIKTFNYTQLSSCDRRLCRDYVGTQIQ